jgi:hypothetical protein
MKIKLYQDLYERYSNLALSFNTDRPTAIKGLETRLIRTFETAGGYGVFDLYLHRGLLWQRSGDNLKRITGFRGERIPSWSWMAYDGGIRYMDIPFGEASWSKDIVSPFSARHRKSLSNGEQNGLELPVWDIVEPQNQQLILDEPTRTFASPLKCVIVGRNEKQMEDEHQIYYTIIVSFLSVEEGVGIYERVGVGFLERRNIALDGPGPKIRIQ